VVSPRMGNHGWPFGNVDEFPAADADPLMGAEHMKDIYLKIDPDYSGRSVGTLNLPDRALIATMLLDSLSQCCSTKS
jgi:glutathionyl-hydroquinone reductase